MTESKYWLLVAFVLLAPHIPPRRAGAMAGFAILASVVCWLFEVIA